MLNQSNNNFQNYQGSKEKNPKHIAYPECDTQYNTAVVLLFTDRCANVQYLLPVLGADIQRGDSQSSRNGAVSQAAAGLGEERIDPGLTGSEAVA